MSVQITSFLKLVLAKILDAQNFENTDKYKICKIQWPRELMRLRSL